MSNKLTIVYITANREKESFEQKIRDKLLEVSGDHPIISVSHKPIDLGENICVGDVGASYRNAYVQMHIGATRAETEYIAFAEADQLYPPGYFDFEPVNDIYNYQGLWILNHWERDKFYQKEYGDWTVIVRKDFLLKRLEIHLGKNPEWGQAKVGSLFYKRHWDKFDVGAPIISVKTPRNISAKTGVMESVAPVSSLPHWGYASELSDYLGLRDYHHEWRRNRA